MCRGILKYLTLGLLFLAIASSVQSFPVANFEDDRVLVEWCHNVFVAKVIKQAGTVDRHGSPMTQFEVEVVLNIQGNLAGKTVISQIGGFRNGRLILLHGGDVIAPAREGSDSLVEPGATYLFSSRFDTNNNWHFLGVSHPSARKLISQDSSLNRAQLEALARQDERVLKLQEALRNNHAFYAEERSPVTEALDKWLTSDHQTFKVEEPEVDTRDLDPFSKDSQTRSLW